MASVPFDTDCTVDDERAHCGYTQPVCQQPDAFGSDAQRAVKLLATQASRAVDGALRFDAVRETAFTDALTGLRNARFLREYLDRELNRASRDGSLLAVLNIDLDNFKLVNDRLGHARGDQTLQEVAEILRAHVRNYDLAARYAGDEFVVVLARSTPTGSRKCRRQDEDGRGAA